MYKRQGGKKRTSRPSGAAVTAVSTTEIKAYLGAKRKKTLGQKMEEAKGSLEFEAPALVREEGQKIRRHSKIIKTRAEGVELVDIRVDPAATIQLPSIRLSAFPGIDTVAITLPTPLAGLIRVDQLLRSIVLPEVHLPKVAIGDMRVPSLRINDLFSSPDLDLSSLVSRLPPGLDPVSYTHLTLPTICSV